MLPASPHFAVILAAMHGVARLYRLKPPESEDWTQAAWVHVLERTAVITAQFRGAASLRTYYGRILTNHCCDWLKERNRSPLHFATPLEDVALDRLAETAILNPLAPADGAAVTDRDNERLSDCLARLTLEDRRIIEDHHLKRRKLSAIASDLGCSPEAARQRLHRAMDRLRALMTGENPPARPPAKADAETLTVFDMTESVSAICSSRREFDRHFRR
jgi:RNA polymerase sigma factor (sigma-70 family)